MNIQGLVWLTLSGVLNNYDYRWMVMLDNNCMGSTELFGTGWDKKFKMKIYVSSGIRTHAMQHHNRWNSALDR